MIVLVLYDSQIPSLGENLYLISITHPTMPPTLLYKATRDGFEAFHSKCNGRTKTVTIIKTDCNFVLGGYTTAMWWSHVNRYFTDLNAFIFSLRRNGISNSEKFMVNKTNNAILNDTPHGPTFEGHDINIIHNSNTNTGSISNFGHSYNLPSGYIYIYIYGETKTQSYLAGSYSGWQTTEIEVFLIDSDTATPTN